MIKTIGVERDHNGNLYYEGDTFRIKLNRYSDPDRLNLARNAAIYLGKADRDNIKRPLRIIKDGHVPAIFRGEMAEFEFIDVSKEVYDHIITYTTANMRATGGNRALVSDGYAMPGDKMKSSHKVKAAIEDSLWNYNYLLSQKETKQIARSAMPVAAKMNPFVYQFNFVTLGESIFKQRIWEKGAQSNTAKVVEGMFKLCEAMDADLWNTFYEYHGTPALQWEEVRKKLSKKKVTVETFYNELVELKANPDHQSIFDEELVDYLISKSGGLKSMW